MVRRLVLASSVVVAESAHYAVLVAGSSGYSNYRHQADVCHSYQVVLSKGIPAENIITMAYDDIANSRSNPFPGKLFNKPTAAGVPGVDVYAGCKIDYTGKDVTPENFQKVLTGVSTGNKVLTSTSEDNVFVFFSDHGAAGLIAFPSSQLHKSDLQATFDTMHSKSMYNKLTFYLETCESGSMFQGMTTPGVYALSASNPTESSWGTYCGSDAMVNGKSVNSCLGDLFSVNWMEDSDAVDITAESLSDQFATVFKTTTKSAVMQWGDLSFQSDMVSEYQGASSSATLDEDRLQRESSAVSARNVDLQQAYHNYASAATSADRLTAGAELELVLKDQLAVEAAYEKFLEIVYPGDVSRQQTMRQDKTAPNNRDCELAVRESFTENGDFDHFTGFALQFHQYVVNVCADSGRNLDLVAAAKQACVENVIV